MSVLERVQTTEIELGRYQQVPEIEALRGELPEELGSYIVGLVQNVPESGSEMQDVTATMNTFTGAHDHEVASHLYKDVAMREEGLRLMRLANLHEAAVALRIGLGINAIPREITTLREANDGLGAKFGSPRTITK